MFQFVRGVVCLLGLFFFSFATAAAYSLPNAPHDGVHGITCLNCHADALPVANRSDICDTCHDGSNLDAPLVTTHSDFIISGGVSSTWETPCLDCHEPRLQMQLSHYSDSLDDLFLVSGIVTTGTVSDAGDTTSFDYTVSGVPKSGWEDPATWGAKTGSGRGLILVLKKSAPDYMFEIASATGQTLTVLETVDPADGDYPFVEGEDFGIIYGQYVREKIDTPNSGIKVVRFFDPNDGFVDEVNPTPEGICQVCHTQTDHWSPAALPADSHFADERCAICHNHTYGFAPTGPETGKHEVHMALAGVVCATCHDLTNLRDVNGDILFSDGELVATTAQCDTCHADGVGGPPAQTDYRVGWGSDIYDLGCSGCHQNAPSSGSHQLHVVGQTMPAIECGNCHDNAVQDTTSPDQHVDTNVDVFDIIPGDLGYPVNKTVASAYANCNNVYCHSDGKGTYQSMTWQNSPAGLGCDGCHGLSTLYGYPDYVNTGPGAEYANNHDTHSEPTSCFYCHYDIVTQQGDAIEPSGTAHIDGNRDIAIPPVFDTGFTYDAGTKTCNNVLCHLSSVQWGTDPAVVTVRCGTCHETPPVANGGASQPHSLHFGIHQDTPSITPVTYGDRGVASSTDNYGFYCGICHPSNQSGHQNDPTLGTVIDPKNMEIDIQTAVARGGTATYDITIPGTTLSVDPGVAVDGQGDPIFYYGFHDGTCTNIYCHSDGQGGPPNVDPTWEAGVAPADCTYCHGNASTLVSGSHNAHLNSAGLGCVECHSATVSDNTTIIDKTRHVSNYFDAAGDAVAPGEPAVDVAFSTSNPDADAYIKATKTCGNLYCHSDGAGSDYQIVTWGAGSIGCDGCHGVLDVGRTDGMPDYANGSPKANSHMSHVVTRGYTCNVCHDATTSNGITISGLANHVDTIYTLQADGGYNFTYTYDVNGGSCVNISCHSNTDAVWGDVGSVGCQVCHLGSGDVDNYLYNDSFRAIIDSTQWSVSGHGLAAGTYPVSNNLAADVMCIYCHDENVQHDDVANPFRLVNTGGPDGMNGVCLICHKTGATGFDGGEGLKTALSIINNNHSGAKHSGSDGGNFCWDCHDPHGDGNIYMVHDAVSSQTDGTYGVPATTETVGFSNNTTGSDYAVVGAGSGICQACHTTTNYYRGDGNGAAHYISKCIGCHKHDNDFGYGAVSGSDCETCHGHDVGYEYSLGLFSLGSGSVESHSTHTEDDPDDFGGPNIDCNVCHVATYPYLNSGNGGIDSNGDTWFELFETKVCDSCHEDGTGFGNPPVSPDYKDGWGVDAYSLSCSGCHEFPPQYGNGFPKANSHAPHVSLLGYTCDVCHVTTTNDSFSIADPLLHTNGSYEVEPDTGYTFMYTYDVNGGACVNISCHGNTDATWGDISSVDCAACHLTQDDDVDNYTFGDPERAYINSDQWYSTGHGVDSNFFYYIDGNPDNSGAGLTCVYCHDKTVDHNIAANPFRLANTSGADGENGVCLICHKTAASGYDPDGGDSLPLLGNNAVAVDTDHNGYKHNVLEGDVGTFCWDCHDPHGDGNIFMVHDAVTTQYEAGKPFGVPAATADVIFTQRVTGTDYAQSDPGPFTGICNVCHTTTNHYTANSGDEHFSSLICTDCHKHDNGFAHGDGSGSGAGCIECHGHSVGYEYATGEFSQGKGTVQSHAAHTEENNNGPFIDCDGCHDTNNFPYFKSGSDGNGDQKISLAETNTCDPCHNDASGIVTGTPILSTPPPWNTSLLSCTGCHGIGPAYANGFPKANSHPAHSSYLCETCHASTYLTADPTLDQAVHAKGSYSLEPSPLVNFTYTFNQSGSTCADISCHGNLSATWGAPLGCDGCHGYPPVSGDGKNINNIFDGGKQAHASIYSGIHVNTDLMDAANDSYGERSTGYNECVKCHLDGVHANGIIDINFPYNQVGENFSYDGFSPPEYRGHPGDILTPKTCFNVKCHFQESPPWSCAGDE